MTARQFTGPISEAKREAAWPAAVRLQQFGYGEISDAVTGSIKLATSIGAHHGVVADGDCDLGLIGYEIASLAERFGPLLTPA